jgi:hypothetical protein
MLPLALDRPVKILNDSRSALQSNYSFLIVITFPAGAPL